MSTIMQHTTATTICLVLILVICCQPSLQGKSKLKDVLTSHLFVSMLRKHNVCLMSFERYRRQMDVEIPSI